MKYFWACFLLLLGACSFNANPIKETEAIDLIVEHLINNQSRNGRFLNHANLTGDSLFNDNYLIVRHAETLYALKQAKPFSDINGQKIDRAIQRGLIYLKSQIEKGQEPLHFLFKNRRGENLMQKNLLDQVTGLRTIIALQNEFSIQDTLVKGLYKGLVDFKDEHGNYPRFCSLNDQEIKNRRNKTLNGAALLGLSVFFKKYPSFEVKQEILAVLIPELARVNSDPEYWDMRLMEAINLLLDVGVKLSEYRTELLQAQNLMVQRAARGQIIDSGSPNDGSFDQLGRLNLTTTRIIGITAVHDAIQPVSDSLWMIFDRAENFIKTAQVKGEKYPGAFTKSSCEIPGSNILERQARYQIRLDYTYHALRSLCAIFELKQKRSSTEADDL